LFAAGGNGNRQAQSGSQWDEAHDFLSQRMNSF